MFQVLFATKSEGVPKMPWAPKEGDDFVVGKREAQRRAKMLLEAGRKGEAIEGLVPYTVEIRSAGTGVLCHGITTEPDDEPVGAWLKGPN